MKPYLEWILLALAILQFTHEGLPPGNADLISVQLLAIDFSHHEDRFLYPGFGFDQNDAWVQHQEANVQTVSDKRIEPNWCFYPPLVPFLLTPFAAASAETWRILWGILQFALIIAFAELIVRLLIRSGASQSPHRILIYALVFGSFPVAHSMWLGQTSVLIAVLVWAGVYARISEKRILAALAIGTAVFVKPFLAVVEMVNLARRKFSAVGSVIAVVAALLLLSLIAAGVFAHREYWNLLSTLSSSQTAFYGNQSLMSALMRFFSDFLIMDYGFQYDPKMGFYGKVLAVAILAIAAWAQWKRRDANLVVSTGLWLSAALIALPISWDHHLLFLIPAVAYLWTFRWSETATVMLGVVTVLISVSFSRFYAETFSGRLAATLPLLGNLILFVFLVLLHVRPRALERVHD